MAVTAASVRTICAASGIPRGAAQTMSPAISRDGVSQPASRSGKRRHSPARAIARSVSLSYARICRACITGEYPTPTGQSLYQIDMDGEISKHAGGAGGGRAYEMSLATSRVK